MENRSLYRRLATPGKGLSKQGNLSIEYRTRPATTGDYEFLYALKKRCLKAYVTAIWGWDETFQQAHFGENFDPGRSQIILIDGAEVGELTVEDREEEIYIAGIYISPEFQNRGLGTQIIRDVISSAEELRLPVKLQVLKVNPAKRLYERLGFAVVTETEHHFVMMTGQFQGGKG